jgi:hypothetical protein
MVPKDGRVLLQIGDRHSLETYFTDSLGKELLPVEFDYGDKKYGTTSLGGDKLPDPDNYDNFENHRGLWMLYLDFKRQFNELQVVNTIHTEDCNMRVEIVSLEMRKFLL